MEFAGVAAIQCYHLAPERTMPQLFGKTANTLSRVTILGTSGLVPALIVVGYFILRSPIQTRVGVVRPQPVAFSHEHHVGHLGIDCRYCHTTVEKSAFAGIPPTHTCMSCHSQIWAKSPMLEPVRTSLAQNEPIAWSRVHNLPDFVYFHHGIHIQKGVGCVSCHGRVDQMPLMWKDQPLTMQWCLDCHRHPERHLREPQNLFRMDDGLPERDQLALGNQLVARNHIELDRLTNCSVCHR
jgi:hypothetical protein